MLNIKINIDAKHSTYNTDFLLRRNSTAYIQRFVSLVFRDMSHQGISKIWLPYTIQILKHRAKKLEGMKCFQSFFGVIDTSKQKGYTCRRQKISPFPERMNPNLVITLSAVLRGP